MSPTRPDRAAPQPESMLTVLIAFGANLLIAIAKTASLKKIRRSNPRRSLPAWATLTWTSPSLDFGFFTAYSPFQETGCNLPVDARRWPTACNCRVNSMPKSRTTNASAGKSH